MSVNFLRINFCLQCFILVISWDFILVAYDLSPNCGSKTLSHKNVCNFHKSLSSSHVLNNFIFLPPFLPFFFFLACCKLIGCLIFHIVSVILWSQLSWAQKPPDPELLLKHRYSCFWNSDKQQTLATIRPFRNMFIFQETDGLTHAQASLLSPLYHSFDVLSTANHQPQSI